MNLRILIPAILACVSVCAVAQAPSKPAIPRAGKSAEDALVYRNTTFGFSYKRPFGWVDRTKEMRQQEASNSGDAKSDSTGKEAKKQDPSANQGEVLLAIFERPPDAPGDSINSAVLIAAENAATYPGLTKAEDYLGPLTELATSKGFKQQGDPDAIVIEARQLIRVDFLKPLSGKSPNDKLTMYQSTLILLSQGQIVSFTFIAGSEDEVDDLIEGLHFSSGR